MGDLTRAARKPLRLEICAWQRAAAGLLIVSTVCNTALYALLHHNEARSRSELYKLQLELQHAEAVRDQAVGELGALALDVARERQERSAQAAAFEAAGAYQYIGECQITAYCCEAYPHICGTGDGLTATGLPVTPGVCAVDPEVIPLGSTVIIDGKRYLAADTGGGVKGLHVDICMQTHRAALAFGQLTADVWVEP